MQLKCEQLEQQRDQLMRVCLFVCLTSFSVNDETLVQERQEWQQLFDKVVSGEATEQKQATESTPMSGFRGLSRYQQKCTGLLQKVGELTDQLSEFTRRLELRERELETMREQHRQLSSEVTGQISITTCDDRHMSQSHTRSSRSLTSEAERGVYEQEIRRLRELLKV